MSNTTDSLSFVEVSGAIGTVLGIVAALAALLAVIFHKNASCCARCLSFVCCRARSNRIESFHVRRVAADVAAISGNHIASISAERAAGRGSAGSSCNSPTYVEPDFLEIAPPLPAESAREPAELPVFAAMTSEQRIALENADPPLAGRSAHFHSAQPARAEQNEQNEKKIVRSADSFKL